MIFRCQTFNEKTSTQRIKKAAQHQFAFLTGIESFHSVCVRTDNCAQVVAVAAHIATC